MNALVVVPTYDERENLPALAGALMAHAGLRVLVVDDGSPDGTGEVADALAREHPGRLAVLHRRGPRGLGRSYVDGLTRAAAEDADVVCQMDADLSHDPAFLPTLIEATARFDVVVGSRYLHGAAVVNWPVSRILLSVAANRYVRAVTRLGVRDCTSGFRCWRREALTRIPLDRLTSDGYAFLVEMLYEAAGRGCHIGEVPIVFVERRHGRSKLSAPILWESLVMPWRLRWRR